MLWQTSLRNLTRKPSRSFSTLIAIFIGICTMFAVISTVETAKTMTTERLKLYTGNADYSILTTKETLSGTTLDTVLKNKDVKSATGLMHRQSSIQLDEAHHAAERRLRLTGLSSLNNELLSLDVVSGNLKNEGIVIPESTAKLWGLKDDETLSLRFPSGEEKVKVSAVVKDTPLLEGPANWEEASNKNWRALAPISRVQEWYKEPGRMDEIRMKFKDSTRASDVVGALQKGINNDSLYFEKIVLDEKQTNQLDDLYFMLYVIGGLAMLISAFILYNTLNVSVTERKSEIAIMKTIGYTPSQIKMLFLIEVFILALISLVIGIPSGFLLASFLQEGLFSSFQSNLEFTMQYTYALPLSIFLGLLIPLIASIIPVNYASKVDVISSLKSIPQPQGGGSRKRTAVGIILLMGILIPNTFSIFFLFLAFILLYPVLMRILVSAFQKMRLFGYEGQIAGNNVNRTLKQSSNMSLILALTICIGLLVSSVFSSLERNVRKDISRSFGGEIQISSDLPLTKSTMNRINNIKGVKESKAYKEKEVLWKTGSENRKFTMISSDLTWFKHNPLFYSNDPSNKQLLNGLKQSEGIVLGDYAFREWGGKIGEKIVILKDGEPMKFKVIGKVNTAQYSGYTAFMSDELFNQTLSDVNPNKGLITITSNADEKKIKDAILDQFPFEINSINTISEEIDKQHRALPGVRSLFDGLLLISIIVAGIGILNTLTMNVMDRIREIGVMRAVAFTSRQIHKMIISEGLIIGTSGVVTGILLGIMTIFLNARTTTDSLIEFIVPVSTVVISILSGILVSSVASFLPSFKAAKAELVTSLKQE
ncbi:ABC transporter permease [Peribacillus frigoritolerans]|uniref:ABC transporter permease n=1 Tax=Peribacillus frigoritolerans TaxID=450367 RepID=UPI0023D9A451|nr:FtsX-like permease family protein [Peribacillus frigoritolerans]MDF1999863.1 FtsX-like permease family protein [Peribacillus frigoritolerans]